MKPILSILVLLLISGCDTIYGISRRATVDTCPSREEVEKLLYSLPEISSVKYERDEGGIPLTLTGLKAPPIIHTYMYSGGTNVSGVLQFTVDYKNIVSYSQTLLALGSPPPQEMMDATEQVMIKIEKLLETELNLTNLQSSVEQNLKM